MSGLKEKLVRLKRSRSAVGGEREAGGELAVTEAAESGAEAAKASVQGEALGEPEALVSVDAVQLGGLDPSELDESKAEVQAGQVGLVHLPIENPDVPALDPRWTKLGVTEHGSGDQLFMIRERRYALEQAHGDHRLGELPGRTGLFSAMTIGSDWGGAESQQVDVETLLFIDTETTGLGVGAGNVPFMIGIGFYDADTFVVQQLFIRNPAEERAMLTYLGEVLDRRHRLVTYNGKCFDWPLVKNRYILNRLRLRDEEPEHFDLLYPSRSLWRNTLPSCRLSIVEKSRLGLSRHDDVPGSMAPELYFLFLAERNPAVLAGVFEHNEKDVMTLAALSVHLAKLLEGTIPLESLDDEELYRMGTWMEKLGLEAKAREAIDLLAERPTVAHSPHALLCAAFYKRRQRYDRAVPLWRELAFAPGSSSGLASLEPLIELAMHYEHRERNAAEALRLAELALQRASQRVSLSRGDPKARAACEQLQQRVARLRRKAASAAEPAADRKAKPTRRGKQPRAAAYEQTLFTLTP
ncbi:ribonuclease H-like domain-containing protein [Paenibacillus sp. HJGM_3]|uniref:ribonuclease H-like domain-containing protein n=1 Tax=Paenibacillus sp. HJGM_3 TaxID=3379816 RepID=UPI00385D52FC